MALGQEASNLETAASSVLPQTSATPQAGGASTSHIMELIQAIANQGQMSGPMTTMQPTMNQPSMPPEFQMGPGQVAQGGFASTGARKRADAQATINNLANFSKSVTDYLHQKKVREYSTTIEKVMNAQSGMNEAQAMLQGAEAKLKDNPKDLAALAEKQQAMDAVAHNQEVLSTIGADPKTAKILEKAFSVKLLGDDKGKASPEYQALQQAIKNKDDAAKKQAGLEMMKKFQATQPTRQQISPQYQAMAQLIKDKVIPEANKRLEQQVELTKNVNDVMQKYSAQESRERLGKMLADAKDRATQATILKQVITEQGRMGAANVMASAAIQRAKITANAMMQDTQWRMAGEVLKEKTKASGVKDLVNQYSKEMQRINDEIKDTSKVLTTLGGQDHWYNLPETSRKIKDAQDKLNLLRQQQETLKSGMGKVIGGGTDLTPEFKPGTTEQDSSFGEFDKFFESLIEEDKSESNNSNP